MSSIWVYLASSYLSPILRRKLVEEKTVPVRRGKMSQLGAADREPLNALFQCIPLDRHNRISLAELHEH
jgi:hypothetical protein